MKTIQRRLLISLVPLLTPLTAFAETEKHPELASPTTGAKDSAAGCRASEIMGLDVKSTAGENIGEVEDLVLDMKSREVLAVVITSGEFLGVDDALSAVPVTALRYDDTDKVLKTRLTKQQLGKAPQFKDDAWPDYSKPASLEELRSYRESIGGDVTALDHAERDKEKKGADAASRTDRDARAKDMQLAGDIRSGIMDGDLSPRAKSIEVISRQGNVTLKGVVESNAEHQEILRIAEKDVDKSKITDDLKVSSR